MCCVGHAAALMQSCDPSSFIYFRSMHTVVGSLTFITDFESVWPVGISFSTFGFHPPQQRGFISHPKKSSGPFNRLLQNICCATPLAHSSATRIGSSSTELFASLLKLNLQP